VASSDSCILVRNEVRESSGAKVLMLHEKMRQENLGEWMMSGES